MSALFLIIALFCFINSYGLLEQQRMNNAMQPALTLRYLFRSVTLLVTGFILPVLCWAALINLHWGYIFFLNAYLVVSIGPGLGRLYEEHVVNARRCRYHAQIWLLIGIVAQYIGISI